MKSKDGILLINKPPQITSFDVVAKVRKKLNIKKVGHAGTLDPFASGLMIILVGSATKLSDYLLNDDKEYIATTKLGSSTDTLDLEGEVISSSEYDLSKKNLLKVMNDFTGEIMQTPPIYSALKVNGKKLYEYARNNEKVEIKARKIEIKKIDLLEFNKDSYSALVKVTKGTYIRTLFYDINKSLNIDSHLVSLTRTKSGCYLLENAIEISEVSEEKIISTKIILEKKWPTGSINNQEKQKLIRNGNKISLNCEHEIINLKIYENIVAVYKKTDDCYRPLIML